MDSGDIFVCGDMCPESHQPRQATACRIRQGLRYRVIVDRIERVVVARIGEPLRIDELCIVAGVSRRTLRNAVRAVYEMTPCRLLRAIRMAEARSALLSQDGATETVTQIAMRFGFLELGRFAVEYRSTFGECPSATRRRTAAARVDLR
jgi:AraC-like DNA-binding protein